MKAAIPDESLRPALDALCALDADFARGYKAAGLPPVRRQHKGLKGFLRIIAGQQVSIQSAAAIVKRLETELTPLTPQRILAETEDSLRALGLSRPKARYLLGLADDMTQGRFRPTALARMDDTAASAHICAVKGLGPWSAEVYLLFSLGRPDVWPAADLAVQEALKRLKNLETRPDEKTMRALAEPWRPHRSAAARFLWHFYRHEGVVG